MSHRQYPEWPWPKSAKSLREVRSKHTKNENRMEVRRGCDEGEWSQTHDEWPSYSEECKRRSLRRLGLLVVLGLIDCSPRVKKHIYRYDLILNFFGMMWWILGYLSFMSTKTIAYLCEFLPWVFAICECWFKNEISSYQEHKGNYYYSEEKK